MPMNELKWDLDPGTDAFNVLEVPKQQRCQIISSSLWGKECFHFKSEVPGEQPGLEDKREIKKVDLEAPLLPHIQGNF